MGNNKEAGVRRLECFPFPGTVGIGRSILNLADKTAGEYVKGNFEIRERDSIKKKALGDHRDPAVRINHEPTGSLCVLIAEPACCAFDQASAAILNLAYFARTEPRWL